MKCPACSTELKRVLINDLEIDVCSSGCAGIWFDRDELFKLDDSSEAAGHAVFDLAPKTSASNTQRMCPKCPHEILVKQFLDVQNSVQIDQCWSCSGIWMDHGELVKIRGQFSSPADREAAANAAASAALSQLKSALKTEAAKDAATEELERKNRRAAWFVGKFLGIRELLDDYKK